MKILEVAFGEYVRRPENQHNTNILRVTHENKLGTSAQVDTLTEDEIGVVATKRTTATDGTVTVHTSRYPWWMVQDVKYEPEVTKPTTAKEPKK